MVESIVVRAHGNWAAISYVALVVLVVNALLRDDRGLIFLNNFLNFFLGSLFCFLFVFSPNLKLFNQLKGYELFANEVSVSARSKEVEIVVVQERMLYSLLSYYLRGEGLSFFTLQAPGSAPSNHFQIFNALPKDINNGFLYIGHEGDFNYLKNDFKFVAVFESININNNYGNISIYEASVK